MSKQLEQEKQAALEAEENRLKIEEYINRLKGRWYTPPCQYGIMLANSPRHSHAGGKRVRHVTNFTRKGIRYILSKHLNWYERII